MSVQIRILPTLQALAATALVAMLGPAIVFWLGLRLTLYADATTFISAVGLPRLKDRGPIEAIYRASCPVPVLGLPRLKDRGPIEAGLANRLAFGKKRLPRLKDRGPIEAILLSPQTQNVRVPSSVERPRPH